MLGFSSYITVSREQLEGGDEDEGVPCADTGAGVDPEFEDDGAGYTECGAAGSYSA